MRNRGVLGEGGSVFYEIWGEGFSQSFSCLLFFCLFFMAQDGIMCFRMGLFFFFFFCLFF